MDDDTNDAEHAEPEPGQPAAPNPFVVPPPAPSDAAQAAGAPRPRARKWRNLVISAVVVVAVFGVISHIGRGKVSVSDIGAGTCIQNPGTGSFKETKGAKCDGPHYAEIMGWINDVSILQTDLSATETEAETRCKALYTQYTGTALDTSVYSVGYYAKANEIVTSDVACFVKSATGADLTQPLRAS